jgi:hypothetical protein
VPPVNVVITSVLLECLIDRYNISYVFHAICDYFSDIIQRRIIKKIFNTKPEGTRKVGKPKLRWEDCGCQNIRILGIKNWRSVALNREEWRIILRKARAHKGMSCQW